jgi:hypothetical protein
VAGARRGSRGLGIGFRTSCGEAAGAASAFVLDAISMLAGSAEPLSDVRVSHHAASAPTHASAMASARNEILMPVSPDLDPSAGGRPLSSLGMAGST